MLTGAIFDVDGTLLDSMHIWRELGERYLRQKGLAAEEGLADKLYPMSLEESSVYLKQRYQLAEPVEKIVSETVAMIERFYREEVSLKPGVAAFLKALKERRIPMAIATSGSRDILMKALDRLRVKAYFRHILTCSDYGVSKREPAIYLAAAEKLGSKPEQTVVFEDVLHGIVSARSAGFLTVAVEDFSNERDRKAIKNSCDYYIQDFTDKEVLLL